MDIETKLRLDAQDAVLESQNKLLDRIDKKLDAAVEAKTAISYIKWVIGGAYAALASLMYHHVK